MLRLIAASAAALALQLLAVPAGNACDMADQYRLFPLGQADGAIVALEADQFRGSANESRQSQTWTITPRLVSLASDSSRQHSRRTVLKEYTVVEVGGTDYETALAATFTRALRDAKKIDSFIAATIERHLDCERLADCEQSTIRGLGASFDLSLRVGEQDVQVSPAVPSLFAKHVNAASYLEFADSWGLTSIRSFTAGTHRFMIVTVGVGTDMNPCTFLADVNCVDDRKPHAVVVGEDVADSVYHQRALHHGHDFDVIIEVN